MAYAKRSLNRKEEIENSLLSLMGEIPYEEIAVKDLTESLGIARKTFYHYFPGKQACLESLTDRLICECNLNRLQHLPPDATSWQIYENRLQFWMTHRQFLEAVNRSKLGFFFLDRMMQYLHREEESLRDQLSTSLVEYDEDILFFYVSGELFLLLKWCHEGFSQPLEEMVKKSLRLVHEPLLAPGQTI